MTNIEVSYEDRFLKVSVVGHAEYAEYGKDIVCSAISILSHSLYIYLTDAQDEGLLEKLSIKLAEGEMKFSAFILDRKIEEGLKPIIIGFRTLSKNYKKNVHFSPKGRDFNF